MGLAPLIVPDPIINTSAIAIAGNFLTKSIDSSLGSGSIFNSIHNTVSPMIGKMVNAAVNDKNVTEAGITGAIQDLSIAATVFSGGSAAPAAVQASSTAAKTATTTNTAVTAATTATTAAEKAAEVSASTGFKAVLSDIASVASPAAKIGSIGMTVYSGLTAADLHNDDGEFSARMNTLQASHALKMGEREGQLREMEADIMDINANLSEEEARLAKLRAAREDKNAGLEMESVLKKKKKTVGKARVAAAANGILLEGREESMMSVYEQDAAAEAAVELEKIRENADVKARVHMANAYIAKANAATGRAKAAMSRYSAAGARYKGAFDAMVATQNAQRARRMGSLQATNDYIGMGASVFKQSTDLLASFI